MKYLRKVLDISLTVQKFVIWKNILEGHIEASQIHSKIPKSLQVNLHNPEWNIFVTTVVCNILKSNTQLMENSVKGVTNLATLPSAAEVQNVKLS